MKKLQMKLNTKGFTLIEMMLVLLVISVLVFLVIPNASKYIKKANTTGCSALTQSVESAQTANKITPDLVSADDLAEMIANREATCKAASSDE
ncbi:MAG: prepilin-type N-terminal cleavage/methylation domain-containing protein [Turicibacter sp.]